LSLIRAANVDSVTHLVLTLGVDFEADIMQEALVYAQTLRRSYSTSLHSDQTASTSLQLLEDIAQIDRIIETLTQCNRI
jgi:hypothetical protein